jgi:hypothetical protein
MFIHPFYERDEARIQLTFQPNLHYTWLMGGYYSDTHPKIEQMQIELIRKMPSWKNLPLSTTSMKDGFNSFGAKSLPNFGTDAPHFY